MVFMAVLLGLFFVQPGQVWLIYVLSVLAGAGLAVGSLVPWSVEGHGTVCGAAGWVST